jgi:hypothetical protein
VWTYTWMSFTSHTFTSLPLVHTPNLDFLRWSLWLGLLLIHESPHSGSLHTLRPPNSNFGRLLNFADFRFRDFAGSWLRELCGSKTSDLRKSATSELRRFEIPDLRKSATSEIRRFEIPDLRKFKIPELRGLKFPDLRRFKIPELRRSRASDLRKFTTSELHRFKIPDFASSSFLKTHSTNFIRLDVSRVTDFPEFPNTSPTGKRVDSDNPIPRKS